MGIAGLWGVRVQILDQLQGMAGEPGNVYMLHGLYASTCGTVGGSGCSRLREQRALNLWQRNDGSSLNTLFSLAIFSSPTKHCKYVFVKT